MKKHLLHKLVAIAILATVLMVNVAPAYFASRSSGSVAAIASNITVSGLHAATNDRRVSNNLTSYSLNSQLNSAAQAKANHMIANDYWAHVAPDGTTPWFFIGQAGYGYLSAGENLAYGFQTSFDTVTGWFNSPSHYANLMSDSFNDVGYGIASGAFQGGQFTVVVAMYGRPVNAPPPPAPEPEPDPPAPEPTPSQPSAPEPDPEPITVADPVIEPTPEPTDPVAETNEDPAEEPPSEQPEPADPAAEEPAQESTGNINPVDQGEFAYTVSVQRITNFEALVESRANVGLVASVSILGLGLLYFAYRHVYVIREQLVAGERALQDHPFLETIALLVALYVLLSSTFGFVL